MFKNESVVYALVVLSGDIKGERNAAVREEEKTRVVTRER